MKIKGIVAGLFAVAIIALYFLGNCEWDLWVLIVALAIDAVFVLVSLKQEERLKSLRERNEE